MLVVTINKNNFKYSLFKINYSDIDFYYLLKYNY